MSIYNVVSSLAVDNAEQDGGVSYPMIGHFDKQMKQVIYWKLAYNYFAVSTRINPEMNHILFTNDNDNPSLKGFDFKHEIRKLGVDIQILPFSKYYISGILFGRFKNTLYKLEVYDQLQYVNGYSVLMDLDCLWTAKWDNLDDLLNKYDLLVLDRNYNRKNKDHITKEMGELFQEINPDYPVKYPVWYGGGFIAGNPDSFRILSNKIKQIFDLLVSRANNNIHYTLSYNGQTMLDGDENIQSYVCNDSNLGLYDVNNYVKIVFTSISYNNASKEDYKYVIWHLASEKLRGLSLLFNEIKNSDSIFWSLQKDDIKYFLGKYVGIDKKPFQLKITQLIDRSTTVFSAIRYPKHFLLHFRYYLLLFLGLR
jgi:hypothetical protein